jgi:hypothetical protein
MGTSTIHQSASKASSGDLSSRRMLVVSKLTDFEHELVLDFCPPNGPGKLARVSSSSSPPPRRRLFPWCNERKF